MNQHCSSFPENQLKIESSNCCFSFKLIINHSVQVALNKLDSAFHLYKQNGLFLGVELP